ncbi:MAG: NUDIX domain-containing protein [Chloroflexota bacterium]
MWRRRGAPEAGDCHLGRGHCHPVHRRLARARGGAPQAERDGVTWTLPKGTPNAGETTEETALREVNEETGLTVEIVKPFESINYTFVQGRTRIHKTVHYFLMLPTGGDLARHDHEFDEVRWIGFDDASSLLTFETERALVARAAAAAAGGPYPGAEPQETHD